MTAAHHVQKMVETIAATTQQEAAAIQEINEDVSKITNGIQTTSATAEESAATSEEMSSQAQVLKELVDRIHFKN